MNILITGGAGYIGSHTSTKAILAGHSVVVLDNLSTGFRESLPDAATIIEGDVRDTKLVIDILRARQVDAIIHFAAKLIVPDSVVEPLEYYDNNVGGVVSLGRACKETGVDNIILSSTAAVYGDGQGPTAVNELTPVAPINPYGWSKLMSERVLRDCDVAFGLRSICLRYFNVAGAAVDGRNGQRTVGATHLIKIASEVAVGKRSVMSVFGTDYPTPDGTCVRDYIHVEDLADLHLLALKYLVEFKKSEILNCGYGKGHSVYDVINTMKAECGVDIKIRRDARRMGDPACLIANSDKIKKLFGWEPKFDKLEHICRSAYEWEKKLV